ncbi:uncharacterized protein LOC131241306 [Magnolia sinica]|uniref:uncharacterized protein LOC131241306 n=1 Tax=Magnolia sinica TaxID=86752 RepID=UPI0026597B56|nr:uncharacterized protein LOC131241306 [Magnolia sinica]
MTDLQKSNSAENLPPTEGSTAGRKPPQFPNPPETTIKPPQFPNPPERTIKPPQFPNPPETAIPDAATLREQWRFAIRQYSKWYSHAWGTAILAGASFFALGWIIKGSNPLPSFQKPGHEDGPTDKNPSSDNPTTS